MLANGLHKQILLLLLMAMIPAQISAAELPTRDLLEGAYVIFKGDRVGGCTVIFNADGSYTLSNETQGWPPAIARPTPGNPYRFNIEGWAQDCKFATILITNGGVTWLFSNGSEWNKKR